MIDGRTAPHAALIMRVCLGILFLMHGGQKLFVFGPAGTAGFFGSLGLPAVLAYLVIALEMSAGIALILGVYARLAALAGIPVLLGAIFLVHAPLGFFFSNPGGGWEFPAFWAITCLVQALLGDGSYALKPTPVRGR
jgi:putative oxidoreductase